MRVLFLFIVIAIYGCSTNQAVCECSVSGSGDIDKFVSTELLKLPRGKPYEMFSVVYRDDGGLVLAGWQKLDTFGGAGRFDASRAVAIAHTHPLITESQSRFYGIEMPYDVNKRNSRAGAGDIDAVIRYRIPNYFRTPHSDNIKAVEIIDGAIITRTVWTEESGYE